MEVFGNGLQVSGVCAWIQATPPDASAELAASDLVSVTLDFDPSDAATR